MLTINCLGTAPDSTSTAHSASKRISETSAREPWMPFTRRSRSTGFNSTN